MTLCKTCIGSVALNPDLIPAETVPLAAGTPPIMPVGEAMPVKTCSTKVLSFS